VAVAVSSWFTVQGPSRGTRVEGTEPRVKIMGLPVMDWPGS